jgi:glycosyltransferase involved in cell wall biosynthesis
MQLKTPLQNTSSAHSKKILQSCLSKSWGGLAMVAFENALALSRNNFECHTLCIEGSPLEKHLTAKNLPTLRLSSQRGIFDFLTVRHFIEEHQIDTVLVQLLKDLRFLSLSMVQMENLHVVAISHTFVNIKKKDLLHRWAYGKINKLICLTELHKNNILEFLPLLETQLEVIPNYVDCERFHPQNRNEALRAQFGGMANRPLFGITSRLDPQKGQDMALLALAELKKRNTDVALVIVGENTLHEANYLAVLKQMTQELEVSDRVHFAGYRENMEEIVASLDVLLMPSKCETFGRVLIEAMASKTPVVATDAGGVPNIIQNSQDGLLVNPESVSELAAAMELLALDTSLRTKLAERAYFKVRSLYAKDVVENKFLAFFNS